MEDNNNIFFKEVPDRVSNVAKGLLIMLISVPATFFSFVIISGLGFRGDMPNPNSSLHALIAKVVSGGLFLGFFIGGLHTIFKSTSNLTTLKTKRNMSVFVFIVLILVILFSVVH